MRTSPRLLTRCPDREVRTLREIIITRSAVHWTWHLKMFLLGFVTVGYAWFLWPGLYVVKRRPLAESVWDVRIRRRDDRRVRS